MAKKKFSRGDFLVEYYGHLISGKDGDKLEEENSTGFRYFFKYRNKEFW